MIIWSGWGILVVAIFLGIGVPIQMLVESRFGVDYYKTYSWPGVLACLLSAPPIWFLGRWLNCEKIRQTGDSYSDEYIPTRQTGRHAFLFVPMEYWALIVIALGLYYATSKPIF